MHPVKEIRNHREVLLSGTHTKKAPVLFTEACLVARGMSTDEDEWAVASYLGNEAIRCVAWAACEHGWPVRIGEFEGFGDHLEPDPYDYFLTMAVTQVNDNVSEFGAGQAISVLETAELIAKECFGEPE